jgi:hypothetical protein
MPRKQKNADTSTQTKKKTTLLNTIVKNVNQKDEHIILQLPLSQHQIEKLTNTDKSQETNTEPIPYERNCCFINDEVSHHQDSNEIQENEQITDHKNTCCFWCCHKIDYKIYGMPINYDSINDTYLLYGTFCSLQCANAYNFSTYNGCDKVWEINSMIQMLAKRYGINNNIRPAPSRYLLKMFNGYLTIDEFRKLHKNNETTHVLNLPPMISISSGYEIVNTSYIKKQSEVPPP